MSFQAVAQVSELSNDLPLAVDVDDDLTIALVRHDGQYFAIEDLCSHGHVPLSEGDVIDGEIECYLHGSMFDLRTGKPTCLPATEPVRVFPCQVVGDQVEVDTANPI